MIATTFQVRFEEHLVLTVQVRFEEHLVLTSKTFPPWSSLFGRGNVSGHRAATCSEKPAWPQRT